MTARAALPLACRVCGADHEGADAPTLCAACGALLPVHPQVSPFALLGLPRPRYRVDERALERAWLERSRRVHPDRFARKSDAERRCAAEQVAALNDAKRALGVPYDRARWLVAHAGVSPAALDAVWLAELMELRERAEDGAAERARVVDEGRARFAARMAALDAALTPLDDVDDGYAAPTPSLRRAATLLAELKTLARLVDDLGGGKLIATLDDR